MARVDTQDIPEEYQPMMRVIFGTGTILIPTGPILPGARQLIRTKAPTRTEPPYVPRPSQLRVRVAFTKAGIMLEVTQYRERHCYYILATGGPMRHVHLYRSRMIPKLYRGIPEQELTRPQASCYEPTYATGFAQMVISGMDDSAQTIRYDFEGDPGPAFPATDDLPSSQYIIFENYYFDEPPYEDQIAVWLAVDPTERTRYTGEIELPSRAGCYSRELDFVRNINSQTGVTVLWRLTTNGTISDISGYNMVPNTMDQE